MTSCAAARVGAALFALTGPRLARGIETTDPCAGRATSVLVEVKARALQLCRGGRTEGTYAVAFGRGGVGKQAEGDNKTPLGTYAIGTPRASERYDTFIPIGYPTEAQRRRGATGGGVGMHGPRRAYRWARRANTWIDWTRGCIAVATDDAIREIAAWVRSAKPSSVSIE
jgi:murein L,D-transpeptidase YafK